MNVLTFLNSLRPAIPTSSEKPPEPMSNSELRRLINNGSVLMNGDSDWKWDDEMPCWVWQLVFFPKSTTFKPATETTKAKPARRTTLVHFDFNTLKVQPCE